MEYGIIAAGIAVFIIAAVNLVGGEVSTLFETIEKTIDDVMSKGPPGKGPKAPPGKGPPGN